ncbi:hypothetical protein [Agrobacterium rosae]|uniref:hypothetical protein n=1 Tax=Agrobacterium rosae TaxID=1972867 RepID=UPI000CD8800D|nr:hypothetical protein [Agrobacterium rosae]POO56273.1 hypothetical protein CTT39_05935 [Agrobacterium rosae]
MDIDQLIDLYVDKGVNAVNDALQSLDDDTQVMRLEGLEDRGFEVKFHYSSDSAEGKPDGGFVMSGPRDL